MIPHRRHRHFNPATAGATLALDARTITGLADGDPVSTWSGRAGTSINGTQTGTARPLYKTAVVNGQPAVRFDGSNDYLTLSSGVADVFHITVCCQRGVNVDYATLWVNDHSIIFVKTTSSSWGTYISADHDAGESLVTGTPIMLENEYSGGSTILRSNGVQRASTGGNDAFPTGRYQIGGDTGYVRWFNGDVCADVAFTSVPSAALRRRIEQSLSFSFRIPVA